MSKLTNKNYDKTKELRKCSQEYVHLGRLNDDDGFEEREQESGEPRGGLDATPLEAVENREECGHENGQRDHEPGDVGEPVRQHRVAQAAAFAAGFALSLRLAEEVGNHQHWWEHDEAAEETVADVLRSEADRADGDCLRVECLFVVRLVEHRVRDHRQEQCCHDTHNWSPSYIMCLCDRQWVFLLYWS